MYSCTENCDDRKILLNSNYDDAVTGFTLVGYSILSMDTQPSQWDFKEQI